MLAKLGNQLGNKVVYRIGVVTAQGILIFCGRLPAADMQILLRLQEQPCPRNAVQLGAQTLDDPRRRSAPLREWLELDVDVSRVAGAAGGT